ncbi:putative tRNA (cytidine(34)-2'-O)-methyltransferase isoform X2 [Juglans regia]|uniref:tRNA (Cytidine(34)-2'-O)-methyltransferase isoform X2 n=1 Tax=Juglans regia TaxID=51240 RepID=A0A6P9E9E5_JUGRE|nr:putative tRNA (cytidine(34)-2'-O)-methyltransferase isoform X2 [Juglans regia]
MDGSSLRALNAISPLHFHFHFRSKCPLFRSIQFAQFKHKLSLSSSPFSPLCSQLEGGLESSLPLPRGVGKAVTEEVSRRKLLQVVLVSPQIPGNTGCIARTCAASAVGLHLVGPLGFQVDDAKLKRAGLDYWPYVVVKVHGSWVEFRDYFRRQGGEKRLLAFTKRGTAIHSLCFCRTFLTEEVIISYLARKLAAYHLRRCWTAKVKHLEVGPFGFQWLKLMLGVLISL